MYGATPNCTEALAAMREDFGKYFPEGHQTRIDDLFTELAESAKAGEQFEYPFAHCVDVHPKAWDIILTHGKHYIPQSWARSKPWEWEFQPLSGSCFLNTVQLIWDTRQVEPTSRATYVEGFCIGPMVEPMLHAWNGIGFAGKCIDWTFYAHTMFNRYFGVPFTFEEYQYINKNGDNFTVRMMFRRDNFERIEERVLEVLQKPRTRLMCPKH